MDLFHFIQYLTKQLQNKQTQTCMVLLSSDSSSAVANSAAFVSVDESKYTIILAAAGGREEWKCL